MMKRAGNRQDYTDEEVVRILRKRSSEEDKVIEYLYTTHYGMIKKLIRSRGGNDQDVQDIFQDALLVFYERVKSDDFKTQAKIGTYLYTVSRNLWVNRLKKNMKLVHDDMREERYPALTLLPKDQLTRAEENAFVKLILNALGDDCKKVLTAAVYLDKSMKAIAQEMGYDNEQIARNKKYKCLQKLKKIIEESIDLTALLNELR